MEPLLRVNNLSKSFGTLQAVRGVSFDVAAGEVVGLAGRSGAGKSVIANILAGLTPPSGGDIFFQGQRLHPGQETRQLGIEVIHQEPQLVERLDITGNIFLGREIGWPPWSKGILFPSQRRMDEQATRILSQMGVYFDSLRTKVINLSSEQRQLLTIARAMTGQPRLVVMDEPTNLLSYRYQQGVLSLVQQWQQQGMTVLFASNNLEHLFAVTDRIIVLRQGRLIRNWRTDETSREEVVAAMMGMHEQAQLTPALWALDSYYRAREQAEKLRHQQAMLERSLEAQDTLNRQLVQELGKQVRALDQANLALQDAQRRLLTEREEERKHLARELHDEVIQDMLSINYRLEEIETDETITPEQQEEVGDIRHSIRELVEDVRRICGNLRPPTIDSFGVGAALLSFTRDWSERTGVQVKLEMNANVGRLPEAIELSIFRIVQEGLSNVRRHAGATAVTVSLQHTTPRTLLVSIVDNGQGLPGDFDLAALSSQGHYGLLGISERVALLGGRLRLRNLPDGGAMLLVEIPHPRVEASISA
ncbi:MAG: ATP-binding cassette domain-containing protein [Anaerolineales bacterium]|nr:ATP-binding cassette domain-containing protein [Anaerolineales bacterium]MCB8952777.1 ATP-binding cassette domain-containing protein [Ardenticatenales bacterium]